VNVDLHPPRPGRRQIAGGLADADVDEASLGPFAPDLVAEEFRARRNANWEVEGEGFAGGRTLRIERMTVLRLQAVEDA
jgi:hypothetical protein